MPETWESMANPKPEAIPNRGVLFFVVYSLLYINWISIPPAWLVHSVNGMVDEIGHASYTIYPLVQWECFSSGLGHSCSDDGMQLQNHGVLWLEMAHMAQDCKTQSHSSFKIRCELDS